VSCKKTSETHETTLHSQLNQGRVWWTDLHVDNMANLGPTHSQVNGMLPCACWMRSPRDNFRPLWAMEAVDWAEAKVMVHEMSWKRLSSCNHLIPLNPWVKWNIHGTVHIHILFVEKSKSCRSEKVKYAENVYQALVLLNRLQEDLPSPFRDGLHVGQTLPRISFTSCISTFERASPPWQMALALLQEMFHCGLRPSIVTYNSAISVART